MRRMLAAAIIAFAAVILPARRRDWGRAMAVELAAIETPGGAVAFALSCFVGAARHSLFSHLSPIPQLEGTPSMHPESKLLSNPRRLAALCAAGAVGLGLAYMAAAGAPLRYLTTNGAALGIGLLAVGGLTEAGRIWKPTSGAVALLLSALVLLTSLFGISADGATRWVSAGGIPLQPGLILIPVVALCFARKSDAASLLAVLVGALALALQPDRAMAGALAAGMAALALARPERTVLAALGGTLAAFVATLVRPDTSPAMPFVDQIFYSSFQVHPLAGLAVLAGAGLMLVPAFAGYIRDPDHRPEYGMFGALWLAVLLAAALGNYPTPLVGYSGSAILGYLLSLLALPRRVTFASTVRGDAPVQLARDEQQPPLRIGLSAAP